jgi:hypothetical protein
MKCGTNVEPSIEPVAGSPLRHIMVALQSRVDISNVFGEPGVIARQSSNISPFGVGREG